MSSSWLEQQVAFSPSHLSNIVFQSPMQHRFIANRYSIKATIMHTLQLKADRCSFEAVSEWVFVELEDWLEPLEDSNLSIGSSILTFSRFISATKLARAFEFPGQTNLYLPIETRPRRLITENRLIGKHCVVIRVGHCNPCLY